MPGGAIRKGPANANVRFAQFFLGRLAAGFAFRVAVFFFAANLLAAGFFAATFLAAGFFAATLLAAGLVFAGTFLAETLFPFDAGWVFAGVRFPPEPWFGDGPVAVAARTCWPPAAGAATG
jgi:hypothetical protein